MLPFLFFWWIHYVLLKIQDLTILFRAFLFIRDGLSSMPSYMSREEVGLILLSLAHGVSVSQLWPYALHINQDTHSALRFWEKGLRTTHTPDGSRSPDFPHRISKLALRILLGSCISLPLTLQCCLLYRVSSPSLDTDNRQHLWFNSKYILGLPLSLNHLVKFPVSFHPWNPPANWPVCLALLISSDEDLHVGAMNDSLGRSFFLWAREEDGQCELHCLLCCFSFNKTVLVSCN